MKRQYWVYILTNPVHTVLYIGMTNNLHRRVFEHRNKFVDGFTKQYNCKKLIYFEQYSSPTEALAREKQLKGWTRKKKEQLINVQNSSWDEILI